MFSENFTFPKNGMLTELACFLTDMEKVFTYN